MTIVPRPGSPEPDFVHLGDDLVYQGHIWRVVVGRFRAPDGHEFTRDIVRSPGAVAVVALDDAGNVVLLRQYRAAFGRSIVEIPAGMRDIEGEDPIETARRELVEEAGITARNWILLHRFLPSTGMTDSVLDVFLATGLDEVDRATHGPEEDHMEVFRVPLTEAVAWVESGEIADAKSTIGLLLADRRRAG